MIEKDREIYTKNKEKEKNGRTTRQSKKKSPNIEKKKKIIIIIKKEKKKKRKEKKLPQSRFCRLKCDSVRSIHRLIDQSIVAQAHTPSKLICYHLLAILQDSFTVLSGILATKKEHLLSRILFLFISCHFLIRLLAIPALFFFFVFCFFD